MSRLRDKVTVLAGATRGIGLAAARRRVAGGEMLADGGMGSV